MAPFPSTLPLPLDGFEFLVSCRGGEKGSKSNVSYSRYLRDSGKGIKILHFLWEKKRL